jgi:hypothetical protein
VSAEFVDDFPERKRDLLQAGMQALILVAGKGGEQPVLNWLAGSCGDRHE